MSVGERVRWYMLGMGTEVDLHTPHWHGNTGTWAGMRTDMIELLPASMKVFDMTADAGGTGSSTVTSTTASMPACWPSTPSAHSSTQGTWAAASHAGAAALFGDMHQSEPVTVVTGQGIE